MGMLGLRDFVVVTPAADQMFSDNHSTALGIGVGVFPLVATAAPPQGDSMNPAHSAHPITALGVGNSENLSWSRAEFNGGSSIACRDCGNKAKKDCKYWRCRTCCKSRGYECATHVKSTWVPAARRRERQMTAAEGGGGSSGDSSGDIKRPRVLGSDRISAPANSHNSNNTSRSLDTTSSHPDGGMPGQVRAPAVFRCVRVSSVEGGADEVAYQAFVRIGGHVFKGFLYDQGLDDKNGVSGSPCNLMPRELHIDSGSRLHSSSSPLLNHTTGAYTTGGGFFVGAGYNDQIS